MKGKILHSDRETETVEAPEVETVPNEKPATNNNTWIWSLVGLVLVAAIIYLLTYYNKDEKN